MSTQLDTSSVLKVKKFSPLAVLPVRKTPGSVGYDLTSVENYTISPLETVAISTGIGVAIPMYHYGRVAPRSGLALKGLVINAGVIDQDYRGEIKVVCLNMSKNPFVVKMGDRIAQLILEQVSLLQVIEIDELDKTIRGSDGFGSTSVCITDSVDIMSNEDIRSDTITPPVVPT